MSEQVYIAIATIVAVITGPIFALLISRGLDNRRLQLERQMKVFRDLMRTRRMRLSEDHVSALNLVEIEFYGNAEVISAWKNYWALLKKPPKVESAEFQAHWDETDRLRTKLIHAMAKSLKFNNIEQLEIFDGGYTPQGWADIDFQNQIARAHMLEILSGKRAIPITPIVQPSPTSPYPPPPEIEKTEEKFSVQPVTSNGGT